MAADKNQVTALEAKAMAYEAELRNDAIAMFRPTSYQEPFFLSMEKDGIVETLIGGGNRSGKSTVAFVYLAAAILNKQVTFKDGSKHWMRVDRWRKEPIKVWSFGYDWKHVGKTIYRMLFKPDLFRIVKDKKTGSWRSWDPDLPGEVPFEQTKPSPPLVRRSDVIPGTMSYENKRENQLASFEAKHDGTRVEFFPSTGAKPQGDPAHIILVDEKLEDESWYSELLVRLIDRRGRLLWATYPGSAPSTAMMAAVERSAGQIGTPNPWSLSYRFKGSENTYTKSTHRDNIFSTMDVETRKIRDEGEISLYRWQIYPGFNRFVHRLLSSDSEADDALAAEFRKMGQVPPTWTRYLILDPGTQHPGILFVAVPPPKFGDFIVPYDEIYIPNLNAKQLAAAVAAKTKGQYFEDFIIDSRAARQTPMGFDGTIGSNYEKEFLAAKLTCRRQGSRFSYGSDNIRGRILRVQGALNIRGCGTPQIRIHGCPNLIQQMEKYRWGKDVHDNPTEEPAKYQTVDIVNCLEYLISRDDCGYVRPPIEKRMDMSLASVSNHIQSFFRPAKRASDESVTCGPASFR